MAPPSVPADGYHVLKNGEIRGPFSLDELQAAIARGEFSERDLVQADGVPIWQPIARLLASPEEPAEGGTLPDWRSLREIAWARLRHDLEERSLETGAVCIGFGVLMMVLSRLPFVFWLPWFAAALVAAIALLRRQRAEQALALLAGVICLPFLFFVVGPSFSKRPETARYSEAAEPEEAVETEPLPPMVTAVPLADAAPATEPVPVVAALDPLPVPPVEEPALVPAPRQPIGGEPATQPLPPSPPVVITDPLREPVSVPAAAPESKEPGMLERAADFLSSLGNKPDVQPPSPTAPLPAPVTAPASAGSAIESVGDFVHQHTSAFVVIKGRDGSGSGFVCRVGSQTYLFTNTHVIAGMQQAQLTRLDGSRIAPGVAHAAAGHDVLRFAVNEPQDNPLEAMDDFANNVRIGDDVVVLGNSGGGGVVTNLPGKIVGIGPDRIEVSAEFIPGNSGSPIVHVNTGKVIGVATYLTKRYEEFASGQAGNNPSATPPPPGNPPPQGGRNTPPSAKPPSSPKGSDQGAVVVRRFAYRLDSIRTWEPVNWALFQQESEQIRQIALLTEDVVGFLRALRTRRQPSFETETLRRPAMQWLAGVGPRVSPADRLRATETFLRALRSMVRSDVTAAEARLRYSYFREELKIEREVRDRLFNAFDVEAKRLASPSERFGR